MGPTGSSSGLATLICTKQLPIILSYLKNFWSISIKFYSVNARFYFQGPALDIGSTCMSNLLAGSNGMVWFLPSMGWFEVVYVNIFNKNSLVRFWFGS